MLVKRKDPLHIRMNGHRSDSRTGKTEKPVAAHFTLPHHSINDLEVRGMANGLNLDE